MYRLTRALGFPCRVPEEEVKGLNSVCMGGEGWVQGGWGRELGRKD